MGKHEFKWRQHPWRRSFARKCYHRYCTPSKERWGITSSTNYSWTEALAWDTIVERGRILHSSQWRNPRGRPWDGFVSCANFNPCQFQRLCEGRVAQGLWEPGGTSYDMTELRGDEGMARAWFCICMGNKLFVCLCLTSCWSQALVRGSCSLCAPKQQVSSIRLSYSCVSAVSEMPYSCFRIFPTRIKSTLTITHTSSSFPRRRRRRLRPSTDISNFCPTGSRYRYHTMHPS